MTPNPIDLQALAGKRYQIAHDEARQGRSDDPWMVQIPCRHGHLYPHSGEQIGVATNTREMGRKVAKLPGAEIWQEGDDGMNVVCPVRHFAAVAKIMGAKRKRNLPPAQREAAAKRLAKFAFKPAAQSAKTGQNRPQAMPVDTLAV